MKYDEKLQRIESKVDTVVEHIGNINITLAKQHVSLEEHMRRSNALEQSLNMLKQEVKPVQIHVAMLQGAFKLFVIVAAVAGSIKAVFEAVKAIKGL